MRRRGLDRHYPKDVTSGTPPSRLGRSNHLDDDVDCIWPDLGHSVEVLGYALLHGCAESRDRRPPRDGEMQLDTHPTVFVEHAHAFVAGQGALDEVLYAFDFTCGVRGVPRDDVT